MVQLVLIGLNHKTAPIAVRERVSLSLQAADGVASAARAHVGAREAVVLSTCNRTEMLLLGDDFESLRAGALECLARRFPEQPERLVEFVYVYRGRAAARHLLRVACGLDSLILGEPQILGQLRTAYGRARASGNAGPWLGRLIEIALQTGKAVHARGGVARRPASIADAAVRLAQADFGPLHEKNVLVIGAGSMGKAVAHHLAALGPRQLRVANRTVAKAQALAAATGGRALALAELDSALHEADVIISATAGPEPVLSAARLARSRPAASRRLLLIDIAVPRDIDPDAGALPGVHLCNIDDLRGVSAVDPLLPAQAERLVEAGCDQYAGWLHERRIGPVIAALYGYFAAQRAGLAAAHRAPDERSAATKALVGRALHEPIQRLKRLRGEELARAVAALDALFGLGAAYAETPAFDEPGALDARAAEPVDA
ncbi:MAG TPA: glutamyl-tRNA reductase [Limnochordia bacterium]|nr:glutamyl-tRNA reductase [Limnochordia bacterium]